MVLFVICGAQYVRVWCAICEDAAGGGNMWGQCDGVCTICEVWW